VCGICWCGIIIFYIADVLLITCGYWSSRLSYVDRLHVLHLSWYIPLGLAVSGFCDTCWYLVLEGRRAVFRLVCLNRLVILCIVGLWYVKVTHFLLCCCVCCICMVCVVCFILAISLFFSLWTIRSGNPLLWASRSIFAHSCYAACLVIGIVIILLM
jgi:hypothetical protein